MKLELKLCKPRRSRKVEEPDDPVVGYRIQHYLSDFWVGLFETPDKYLAISQAIEVRRSQGMGSTTTKDLIVQPVTQSGLEKVRAAHGLEQEYLKATQMSNSAPTADERKSWESTAYCLLGRIRGT
jgi:hypothetical protein